MRPAPPGTRVVIAGPSMRPRLKIAERWTYLYRAIDQHGQIIDIPISVRRDDAAARTFVTRALRCRPAPVQVTTDPVPGPEEMTRLRQMIRPIEADVADLSFEDQQQGRRRSAA